MFVETYSFDISNHRYIQLLTDVKKFNKIATRMNAPEIIVSVDSTYKSFDPLAKINDDDLTWALPQIDYHRGTISNFNVSLGDYSFIGSLHHSKKNIDGVIVECVKARPFIGHIIPDQYKNVKPTCEHCQTKRNRNITYIVLNNETGEYLQVGSTCFNVFLNCDASDIIRLLRIVTRISDVDGYEEKTRKRKKYSPLFNVNDILRLTNAIIRLYGYHPRNNGTDNIPTADIVTEICANPTSNESIFWLNKIKENRNDMLDEAAATATSKWALTDVSNTSSYMNKVRQMLKLEVVSVYKFGTLCSAIEAHKEETRRKITIKEKFSNEFFGKIGGNYAKSLKCIDKIPVNGYNGQTYLIRMVDDNRNIFTWFHDSGFNFRIGQIKKLKFKVKNHTKFRSQKQTLIFWVKEINEYDDGYTEVPEFNVGKKLDTVV